MVIPRPHTPARTRLISGVHLPTRLADHPLVGPFAALFGYLLLRYVVLKLPVVPPYTVGPFTVTPFGPLVALGILFGIHLTRRWCGRFGLDWATMQAAVTWVLGTGLVLAHVVAIGGASPARLLDPSALLALRSDFSSFGGFLGSTLAALYFCKTRALALRPVGDALLYGFIGGWLFGRLGCFAVHDHPGWVTTLPTGVLIQGLLRHDLGFYELVFTLLLFSAITVAIHKRKRFDGFVIAVTATTYPVVRFGLDVLRVGEASYAGLTMAQWGCLPLLVLGVYTLRRGWSRRMGRPAGPCVDRVPTAETPRRHLEQDHRGTKQR